MRSSLVTTECQLIEFDDTTCGEGSIAEQAVIVLTSTRIARRILSKLLCRPAAVHADICSCNRRSLITAKKGGEGADLFGSNELLGRLGREEDVVDHLLPS